MTPRTVLKAQHVYNIKDTNPETRALFAWYINKNGVTPKIAQDIHNLIKEGGDLYQFQQRLWTYTLERLILETQKRLQEFANGAEEEDKTDLETDYVQTELFERSLRNIAYNTLSASLLDYYKDKQNV